MVNLWAYITITNQSAAKERFYEDGGQGRPPGVPLLCVHPWECLVRGAIELATFWEVDSVVSVVRAGTVFVPVSVVRRHVVRRWVDWMSPARWCWR